MIATLLRPKFLGIVNQWKEANSKEKVLIVLFSIFGIFFWIGLSALFWYFIKTFYGINYWNHRTSKTDGLIVA